MKLSKNYINDFRSAYGVEFGVALNEEAGRDAATLVAEMLKALTDPIDSDCDAAFVEDFTPPPKRRKVGSKNTSRGR
jgi:hypothetical protein